MQKLMETRLAQTQASSNVVTALELDNLGIGEWFDNLGDDIEGLAVDSYESVTDWFENFATETLPSWDAAAENWLENATETRQEWATAAQDYINEVDWYQLTEDLQENLDTLGYGLSYEGWEDGFSVLANYNSYEV